MSGNSNILSAASAARLTTQLDEAKAVTTDIIYNPDAKLGELFPDVSGDAELLDAIFQVYEATPTLSINVIVQCQLI